MTDGFNGGSEVIGERRLSGSFGIKAFGFQKPHLLPMVAQGLADWFRRANWLIWSSH